MNHKWIGVLLWIMGGALMAYAFVAFVGFLIRIEQVTINTSRGLDANTDSRHAICETLINCLETEPDEWSTLSDSIYRRASSIEIDARYPRLTGPSLIYFSKDDEQALRRAIDKWRIVKAMNELKKEH